jgi:flagellar biosynthesis protein FlhB
LTLEKTEWPNKARLEELREQGIVHYSVFVSRAAGLVAFLCVLYALKSDIAALARMLPAWMRGGDPAAALGGDSTSALLRLVLLPPLSVFVVSFIFGFAQTRFLFRPASLALSWKRIYAVDYRPPAMLGRAIGALIVGIAALAFGIGAALILQRDVLSLLNGNARLVPVWGSSLVLSLIPLALIAAAAALAVWWGISRILFSRAHRMTRREALQYQRED